MNVFVIMKNGKFVKDFTDGTKVTTDYRAAEKYVSKKNAVLAARKYSRDNGKGYSVVEV